MHHQLQKNHPSRMNVCSIYCLTVKVWIGRDFDFENPPSVDLRRQFVDTSEQSDIDFGFGLSDELWKIVSQFITMFPDLID